MNAPRLLLLLGIMTLLNCNSKESKTLRVATAANMQFAMKEIAVAFTNQTQIPCDLIVSSSGKLTAQIQEGAPYDVFLSADMKYPNTLQQSGHTTLAPKVYARGNLILWSMGQPVTLEMLTSDQIKHIAIANPKTAPYGSAAITFLKVKGIYDLVEPKLVYGESIAQVNQFVHTQAADVGFTALSVVYSLAEAKRGYWVEIDRGLYPSIEQGVVLLSNNQAMKQEAVLFYEFLFSEKGQGILEGYGYE